ncbi:MAG: hypothetical protein QXS66_08805 [Thermoproteota archaeon]
MRSEIYLKIDCIPHWGWRLNLIPFSKSRPPLRVLPPTTLIGALALPLNRILAFPETYKEFSSAERFRQALKYVGYKLDSPLVEYFDLSRISFYYRGKAKTDAVAVGKTYLLSYPCTEGSYKITLCFIINESKFSSLLENRNTKKELLRAACSIIRLGSRESTFTPMNVSMGEAKLLNSKQGETSFSFLRRMTTSVKGSYIMSQVIDWEYTEIGDYKNASFDMLIVPYNATKHTSEKVYVELADKYVFYDVDGEIVVGVR